MLKFVPVSLQYRKKYEDLYQKGLIKSSDYTFINLWSWQQKYKFEWAFDNDLCWIRSTIGTKTEYFMPIGVTSVSHLQETLCKHFPDGGHFNRVTEDFSIMIKQIYGEKSEIKELRDHWEYVYSIKELIELSGPDFRNKRKLANQFKQYYDYRLTPITQENIPDIKQFQKQWLDNVGKEQILREENRAINKILDNWQIFSDKILGGILWVEDKIAAYTIGEAISSDMLIIHFEKADYDYKGAYQAVNQLFLENFKSFVFVNREQDLGLPGLRKAKTEYNPVYFIKKYNIFID